MSISYISVLRQLARLITDSHQENAYIETTIFHKYGMRPAFERLRSVQGDRRPTTGMEVATAYNSGLKEVNELESKLTLDQMWQTGVRFEMCVSDVLGAIMNE